MRLSSIPTRWDELQIRRKRTIVGVSSYINLIRSLTQLLFLCSAFCLTSGLHFYLDAGTKRCFSESAPPNTKVLIEYTVSTGAGIMPVDLSVSINKGAKVVVNRENVEHGKVAFVLPISQVDDIKHIYQAEAHRRPSNRHRQSHSRDSSIDHAHENSGTNQKQTRRLLSMDEDAHDPRERRGTMHHEAEHENYHHDPESNHHYAHGHGIHDVGPNDDETDYDDVDDDIDDVDMDNYDGIHDEDLDKDMARNELEHSVKSGTLESLSDASKEQELFTTRRFDLCLSNVVHKDEAKRRRVRLIVRKGDTAHDYSRLAKNEHMSQLESSLKRISDELKQLMHELDQTQQMEDLLYRLNRGTNEHLIFMCIMSLLIMVGVGGYQATYTKKYLKRKKVL